MKKIIRTTFTEVEFRQIISEEVKKVLSNDPGQVIPDNEGFLNTDQTADLIKLKKTTLYNLINQNKIPFHKSGKKVLFKKTELIDWINEKGN